MVRVSQLFPSILMWLFSQLHGIVGEFHLISGYLSEGIDLRVAVYSECLWEEGRSRGLLFCHLPDVPFPVFSYYK